MEKDANFTHIESLSVIQALIHKAKDQLSENGHLYLLWGWVILVCSISHFILIKYFLFENIVSSFIPYQYHLLLLALAVIIAWIIPGYILRAGFKKLNT